MKTKSIKQSATFIGSSEKVYQLIMDQKKHAAFSDADVVMSNKLKGLFSTYDGYCHGYNIELVKGKKIVQAWHFAEDGWPEDHYSICTFLFDQVNGKTKLSFSQTDVPEHKVVALKDGWKKYYWKPMAAYLNSK